MHFKSSGGAQRRQTKRATICSCTDVGSTSQTRTHPRTTRRENDRPPKKRKKPSEPTYTHQHTKHTTTRLNPTDSYIFYHEGFANRCLASLSFSPPLERRRNRRPAKMTSSGFKPPIWQSDSKSEHSTHSRYYHVVTSRDETGNVGYNTSRFEKRKDKIHKTRKKQAQVPHRHMTYVLESTRLMECSSAKEQK